MQPIDRQLTMRKTTETKWPKGFTHWTQGGVPHISVPFTWNLPQLCEWLERCLFDHVVVGGPGVYLMPEYLEGLPMVDIQYSAPDILQRVNPMATRTTTGCINKCRFCGIGEGYIEPGGMVELEDWPDNPILCDNNILAASPEHFDRVMERLEVWDSKKVQTDFNQGVDARLLNEHHAERIGRLKKMMTRLAMDSMGLAEHWERAFGLLRDHGVPKFRIRSYVLIGFKTGPEEAWTRCEWVETHGVKALPMWFHPLNALKWNAVTEEQKALGWTDELRRQIMRWYYQHTGSKPDFLTKAA